MMTPDRFELIDRRDRRMIDPLEVDIAMACRVVGRREWSSAVTVVAHRRPTDAELVRCRSLARRWNVDLTMDVDGAVTVRSGRTAVVRQARQWPVADWLRAWNARRRHEALPVASGGGR